MERRKYIKTIALGAFLPALTSSGIPVGLFGKKTTLKEVHFKSNWENWPDMKWVGPEYWGNRLQDWSLENGKVVCGLTAANRTLQLLTIQKTKELSRLTASVRINKLNKTLKPMAKGCFGMRFGAKGPFEDYRSAAVFGEGLDIGFNLEGNIVVGKDVITTEFTAMIDAFELQVDFTPHQTGYKLNIAIIDLSIEKEVFRKVDIPISAKDVVGNFALLADSGSKESENTSASVAFSNWKIDSQGLYSNENQLFGPIYFAQYTVHQNKLKLTAQLAPIEMIKKHEVLLQIKEDSDWKTIATKRLEHIGRAINFEIDDWLYSKDIPYRVLVQIPLKDSPTQYAYEGTISQEPNDKHEVSLAVLSCNFHYGFPDTDIQKNINSLKPDVILFLGDQFYEATGGFGIQNSGALDGMCLDYLRKWAMFGWSYRELFRHKPCAIIPDDHDVYHGNVWGEEGKKADVSKNFWADAQDSGGYKMPAEWVNMVQFTQTSHLPDPYDPAPVKQNIGVYYTNWNYAGLSFAILEDRKFKSAPKHVLPKEAEVWNGFIKNPDFDIKKHKDLNAELLGKRQEGFLNDWVEDWSNGTQMKVLLSQTNFATVATLPKGTLTDEVVPSLEIPEKGAYVLGDAPTVDMDSNGWPSNKRDKAVETIRKGFAFHIAGDQHLGSFIQYGVAEHGDSGFAFAGPALNNIWPRRFWPPVENSSTHTYKNPAYTGNHIDGFGNKITVMAVANPYNTNLKPEIIHNRATGYGLVTLNKKERTITTACWARSANPLKGTEEQLPGWPVTVFQDDNYGRKAVAWLPEIKVIGNLQPVVKIYDDKNELLYAIRMATETFKPKVFSEGSYKIMVQVPETGFEKLVENVAAEKNQEQTLEFNVH